MIHRIVQQQIIDRLFKQKAILLTGPRQVGKSTLLKQIKDNAGVGALILNCEEPDINTLLYNATTTQLRSLLKGHKLLLIDEAQKVQNIGTTIKLIVDNIPDTQVIATGSSAFDLRNAFNESLTGRKFEFHLYPFSTTEMILYNSAIEEQRMLEQRLIYGMYPDVVLKQEMAKELLLELKESYLYRDILSFKDIRKPDILTRLLTAIALQLGNEVSYNELSNTIGVDKTTVERYIELLEKCFVIFRLSSFCRNLRNELKKSKKIYFYDNGIRNAILNNFSPLTLRTDSGALWENFLVTERLKFNQYNRRFVHSYFWRTNTQQEIDLIEDIDGQLHAFEFKWNSNAKSRLPKSFAEAYPNHTFTTVTPDNYITFLQDAN